MMEDTNVTAKEYRKMQKFLLLIAGCIAIDQTLLSIVILLSLLMGLQIAWKERGISQLRVWPRHLKCLLLLLLATGYASLHNPLVTHPLDCTFNFVYVVGQYVSVVWLVTRFGNCFAGKSPFARPAPYEDGLPFWKVFMRQPFPLRMLPMPYGLTKKRTRCCGTVSFRAGRTPIYLPATYASWQPM